MRQHISSWDAHVRSWTTRPQFPVRTVRYEDLLEKPAETFQGIIEFLSFHFSAEALSRALKESSFMRLKKMELREGFGERPSHMTAFFRSGGASTWETHLSPRQELRLRQACQAQMERFGYDD